jgi:16S rRNA (uracil1498-N3)-methyltransferase
MSRFYVSPESIKGGKIYVEKEESHHIIDVMRLREGDSVTAFDGTGKEYSGKVSSINNKRVAIDILGVKTVQRMRPISISLAQAVPKRDSMDLIVQKATELGADEIIPFESSRTVVKAKGERRQHKIGRWQKIAIEASKQCGRAELPEIRDIEYFADILGRIDRYDLTIMPCLSEKAARLKSALMNTNTPKKLLVIIGPEGGFSEKEIDGAAQKGVCLITLGNLVLRSDTAAITTLSILNYALGI